MIIKSKELKGSITVEAAFSFTLTVFVLFLMLGPLLIIKTTSDFIIELDNLSKARCDYEMIKYQVKDTGIYKTVVDYIGDSDEVSESIEMIKNVVNYTSLLVNISNKYGDNEREYDSINYIYDMNTSNYDENTCVVKYDYLVNFSLPYNVLNVTEVNKRLVSYRRAFVGADGNRFDEEYEDGEYVYVANNYVRSSVYHGSINCTYLIKKTTSFEYKDLSNYRNYNNKKYSKCDYCFKKVKLGDNDICYVTQYGDKFHYKSDCPRMTAYVTKILKSHIEEYNLRPCFKCVKEE